MGAGMKRTILLIAAVAVLIAGPVSIMAGCYAEDVVTVKTPQVLVDHIIDLSPTMTYAEATDKMEVLPAVLKIGFDQWGDNAAHAATWVQILNGLQTLGVTFVAEQLGIAPQTAATGGGLLGGGLAGVLVGWLGLRRPGDVTADESRRREHESWDESEKKAKGSA